MRSIVFFALITLCAAQDEGAPAPGPSGSYFGPAPAPGPYSNGDFFVKAGVIRANVNETLLKSKNGAIAEADRLKGEYEEKNPGMKAAVAFEVTGGAKIPYTEKDFFATHKKEITSALAAANGISSAAIKSVETVSPDHKGKEAAKHNGRHLAGLGGIHLKYVVVTSPETVSKFLSTSLNSAALSKSLNKEVKGVNVKPISASQIGVRKPKVQALITPKEDTTPLPEGTTFDVECGAQLPYTRDEIEKNADQFIKGFADLFKVLISAITKFRDGLDALFTRRSLLASTTVKYTVTVKSAAEAAAVATASKDTTLMAKALNAALKDSGLKPLSPSDIKPIEPTTTVNKPTGQVNGAFSTTACAVVTTVVALLLSTF